MEIIKAGEKQLTICQHCKGESQCQFATTVWWEELSNNDALRFYALKCNKCGKGIEKEKDNGLIPPVCSVCEGKGYLLIG